MDVTVTVPTLNEENYLPKCLEDLEKSIENFEGEVEVILVDSHSTDDTIQIAENSDVIDEILYSEKGILRARDKGIRNASNPVVICIDADTRYTENYIEDIISPILKENKSLAYGPAKGERGLHLDSLNRFILQNTLPWIGLAWVSGSNRAIKKEDYFKLGGYDLAKDGKSVLKVMWEEQFIFPLKISKIGGIEYVKNAKSYQSHRTMDQLFLKERKQGGKSWNLIEHYNFLSNIKSFLPLTNSSFLKRKSSR